MTTANTRVSLTPARNDRLEYRDVIRDAIYEDVKDFYGDLMRYYREDDSVRRKVVRAIPTVDEVNGNKLGGPLTVELKEPLR